MNQAKRINPIQWLLVSGGLLLLLLVFFPRSPGVPELEISQVLQMAQEGRVAKIQVRGDKLDVTTVDGEAFQSRKESSVSVLELLDQRGITTGTGGIEVDVRVIPASKELRVNKTLNIKIRFTLIIDIFDF